MTIGILRRETPPNTLGAEGFEMVVTQDYGWSQLARKAGHGWPDGTAWAMEQAVASGLTGWEPFLHGPEDVDRIGKLAQKLGLSMPSVFVSGLLHEDADATLAQMLVTAQHAATFGTTMVVVYPSNLGTMQKTDVQLIRQVENLTSLAQSLKSIGVSLLYHPEEPEMAFAAREFHHMLAGTDPDLIRFCLDPDTNWRGGGQSMLAVLDVIQLYGDRIDAIHIRQSQGGIWAETVGTGDLDYAGIAKALTDKGRTPLLVLEHAYDDRTPQTLDPVTAHRQSIDYIHAIFKAT